MLLKVGQDILRQHVQVAELVLVVLALHVHELV